MKYTKEYIKKNNIVIQCFNEEEWLKVATALDNEYYNKIGYWNKYVIRNIGERNDCQRINSYSDKSYYKERGYTIISASEFLENCNEKSYGINPVTELNNKLKGEKTMTKELNIDLTKTLTANIEVSEAYEKIAEIKQELESRIFDKRNAGKALKIANENINLLEKSYKEQVAIITKNTKKSKK